MLYCNIFLVMLSFQTNSFIHAHIQLEVVRYALKADNLILHSEFMSRLRTLPLEYTYGEYRQLYSDYGTHYITEAKLGGTFDHTLILNKENIEKSSEGKAKVKIAQYS